MTKKESNECIIRYGKQYGITIQREKQGYSVYQDEECIESHLTYENAIDLVYDFLNIW